LEAPSKNKVELQGGSSQDAQLINSPSPKFLSACVNPRKRPDMRNKIIYGENLETLKTIASGTIDLIYIDPPFNTGKIQSRVFTETRRDDEATRVGFGNNRYSSFETGRSSYSDKFDDFIGFLRPRLEEAYRVLSPQGSLFFHIDCREVHYCKILLDEIFDRTCFQNEIIWAYDYGARSKKKWPAKHDNILWYTKDPTAYTYRSDESDRIPYMAPSLVGAAKASIGKTPTDVWWHTIVSPTGKEKTGYATQKPLGVIERIVKVHSHEGDLLLDFFAGSGTLGEAAAKHKRDVILIDSNQQAIEVMLARLQKYGISTMEVAANTKHFGT
jgi:site-specific DNA-methyltransferase (adenine-specific)